LRYQTQYEPTFARAAARALKIREHLVDKGGIDDLFPARPKNMHRKTYELEEEFYRLNDAWAVGIMVRFRSSATLPSMSAEAARMLAAIRTALQASWEEVWRQRSHCFSIVWLAPSAPSPKAASKNPAS
jgi:hypothetical protein